MPSVSSKTRPVIFVYVTTAIILWGFSFIWTNQLLINKVPVFTFIFWRMFIAAIIMVILSALLKKLQKVSGKDLLLMLLMALFEPFIYFIGETFGLKATNSPTLSALIIATIPIFAMLSEIIFYKVKISLINILGVLITLPGILLMVLNSGKLTADYWWGIALLFVAVLGSVGYTTVVRKLTSGYNSYTLTSYQFLFGSIFFLPLYLIKDKDYSITSLFTPDVLIPLLALAILCSCLAFFLYINSIREIGITRSSIFTSLIPGVSAFGAYIYGQETFTWYQILGIAIVVTGVIFTQLKKKKTF